MDGTAIMQWTWLMAGLVLMLLLMADIFLTVLYARVGTGVLSKVVARVTWWTMRGVAKLFPRVRGRLLSFAGPAILVLVVVVWIGLLTLGAACVIYPHLGAEVKSNTGGKTPIDFMTAVYTAGNALSIGGSSEFAPQTGLLRAFFLFDVFLGMSSITLILTYLMEIYGALQRRNTLAVKLTLGAGDTSDGAEWLARVGSRGRFEQGYGLITETAAEIADIKESHHFYPVLFYFRFRDACYATPRFAMMVLDAMALAKSALNEERFGWLQESAGVGLLETGALEFVRMLAREFLPRGAEDPPAPTQEQMGHWRRRYFGAVERFRAAGIATVADENAGAEQYIAMRRGWDHSIERLADFAVYDMCEIEPICWRGRRVDESNNTRRTGRGGWRAARA